MQDGMIFQEIGKWLNKVLASKKDEPDEECSYWAKPISCCPVCMGFWWGMMFYWLLPWSHTWPEALIVSVSLIGMNYILIRLFP